MRTTNEIIIAVNKNEPVGEDELRLCIAAMTGIHYFEHQALLDIIETARDEEISGRTRLRVEFAWGTVERMFDAYKKPPAEWLGLSGIPGSPEKQQGLKMAKAIFKDATGIDLDEKQGGEA